MAQGRRVLCFYPGERVWQERLLLGKLDEHGYILAIVTPDGDLYGGDFRTDYTSVKLVPVGGGEPRGLVGKIYTFSAPPSPDESRDWAKQALALVTAAAAARASGTTVVPGSTNSTRRSSILKRPAAGSAPDSSDAQDVPEAEQEPSKSEECTGPNRR